MISGAGERGEIDGRKPEPAAVALREADSEKNLWSSSDWWCFHKSTTHKRVIQQTPPAEALGYEVLLNSITPE